MVSPLLVNTNFNWLLRKLADSDDLSSDKEDAALPEEPHLTFGQSHHFAGSANLRKSQDI